MTKRLSASIQPRACRRCQGDAYLDQTDEPEWRCLQCGRAVQLGQDPVAQQYSNSAVAA